MSSRCPHIMMSFHATRPQPSGSPALVRTILGALVCAVFVMLAVGGCEDTNNTENTIQNNTDGTDGTDDTGGNGGTDGGTDSTNDTGGTGGTDGNGGTDGTNDTGGTDGNGGGTDGNGGTDSTNDTGGTGGTDGTDDTPNQNTESFNLKVTVTANPQDPLTDGDVTLIATITNEGTSDSVATTLQWYSSPDATVTSADNPIGDSAEIKALAPQGTRTFSTTASTPSHSGAYYYRACAIASSAPHSGKRCGSVQVHVTPQAPTYTCASGTAKSGIPAGDTDVEYCIEPSVTLHSDQDEYAHITSNGRSTESTYQITVDTEAHHAWRLYFVLSNGGQNITTTPTVKTLSLPDGATDGPDIPDLDVLGDSSLSLARQHGDALPSQNEYTHFHTHLDTLYNIEDAPAPRAPIRTADTKSQNQLAVPAYAVGDTDDIYTAIGDTTYNATARLVRTVGAKTLVIWTAPNVYSGCTGNDCLELLLTDTDIVEIADKFLQSGEDNDIYDWVTAITGPEWGPHPCSLDGVNVDCVNYIPSNDNTIHIFLYDVEEDRAYRRGTLGHYRFTNSYKKNGVSCSESPNDKSCYIPTSNEKLLLYIDAPFAKDKTGGAAAAANRHGVYFALAHELQHMIHYYQRILIGKRRNTTWLNEQFSLMIEDLIAQRLYNSYSTNTYAFARRDPRGLTTPDAGIYPTCANRIYDYAQTPYWGVSRWENKFINYSVNYAFGAYMLRNYSNSNTQFFKRAYQSGNDDMLALVDAAQGVDSSVTESSLIERWGISVLLSDQERATLGYRYNFGFDGYATPSSTLGSINYYNYGRELSFSFPSCLPNSDLSGPALHAFRSTDTVRTTLSNQQFGHSFLIVAAAQNVDGSAVFEVTLPPHGSLAVVAKREKTHGPSFFPSQ